MSDNPAGALEAAGLAKITVVYLDKTGIIRTNVYVMPRDVLDETLTRIAGDAVG